MRIRFYGPTTKMLVVDTTFETAEILHSLVEHENWQVVKYLSEYRAPLELADEKFGKFLKECRLLGLLH